MCNVLPENGFRNMAGSCEQPERFAIGGANEGVAVIGVQFENPIVSVLRRRAEEFSEEIVDTDFKFGVAGFFDRYSGSSDGPVFAVLFVGRIDEGNVAIRIQAVLGGCPFIDFLEYDWESGNFVPQACILFQVNLIDGLGRILRERVASQDQG